MINASNERICVEFEERQQHNLGLPTFKLPASINPFCCWRFQYMLLGYRTNIRCLNLPQGHNLISTVWLLSTDDFLFWTKVHL